MSSMISDIKAVVLAAGKSKRMKSGVCKMIHKILGKEIINYLLDSLIEAGIHENQIIIVAGDNITELKNAIKREVTFVIQEEQLGTAHALLCANEYIETYSGGLLVTVGDNPYITAEEITCLIGLHNKKSSSCTVR